MYASSRVEKMRKREATSSRRKCTHVKTGVETHKCAETRQSRLKTRRAAVDLVGETHGPEARGQMESPVARAAALRRGVS